MDETDIESIDNFFEEFFEEQDIEIPEFPDAGITVATNPTTGVTMFYDDTNYEPARGKEAYVKVDSETLITNIENKR